jgi:uncharacterized protein
LRERFSPLEFAVVIGVAFGNAIFYSLDAVLRDSTAITDGTRHSFGSYHIYSVVIYELLLAPVLAAILYVGGWRPKHFPIGAGAAASAMGLLMFAGMWIADWVLSWGLQLVFPAVRSMQEMWAQYQPADPPGLLAILLLVLVNPAFEELIVCGYVIPALRGRFGDTTAVNVSVVIRSSYHLYQGFAMLPWHTAYGLVQAHVYLRFGRLWPLIVSHAALDLAALAYYLA